MRVIHILTLRIFQKGKLDALPKNYRSCDGGYCRVICVFGPDMGVGIFGDGGRYCTENEKKIG